MPGGMAVVRARAARAHVAIVGAAWAAACAAGEPREAASGPAAGETPAAFLARFEADPDVVFEGDEGAVEAKLAALAAPLRRGAPGAASVRARRRVAALAVAVAYRTRDGRHLGLGRALLSPVARLDAPGACAAALDLARLEARDAGDLAEAHRVALVAASDFAEAGDPGCLAGLRRVLVLTEADRPPPDRVARALGGADDDSAPVAGAASRLEAVRVLGPEGGRDPGSRVGAVRIVLALDAPASFESGALPADDPLPPRLFVDLPVDAIAPGVPATTPVEAGGLRRVRVASHAPGVVRVVFDLAPGAGHRVLGLPGSSRLWVDVFARADRPGSPGRVVVLDPGHGGADRGAEGGDLAEADLALDLALRAARALEAGPGAFRVLLTRREDVALDLEARTAFANAMGADAFVSIHLNAADAPVRRGGVTTFVLDTTGDAQAIRLAARENGTTPARVTRLQRILAGLHRAEQVDASRDLAASVQAALLREGGAVYPGLADRGVKEAGFHVLVGARMPAVLVEASFLTHPADARALRDPAYREALAGGLAAGVRRWASAR